MASDVNMYRYVVKKNTDGKLFKEIGSVAVKNNNCNNQTYDYSDTINTTAKQMLYYRVRSEYQNGKLNTQLFTY